MAVNMRSPDWREDPLLKGRFHPEYPDDLQVIVHDGGPRVTSRSPELMWVRVTGRHGSVYVGTVLNVPHGLSSVRQGSTILFMAVPGIEHPFRVTEEYLQERAAWNVGPCSKCGLSELWDPPSDLLRKIFPNMLEDASVKAFTSFCPLCGGDQVVTAKQPGGSPLHSRRRRWWEFWRM